MSDVPVPAALRAPVIAQLLAATGQTITREVELRIGDLLGEWVFNDRNHVRQLLAVTQARIWEQMGNARRFSEDADLP